MDILLTKISGAAASELTNAVLYDEVTIFSIIIVA